MEPIQRHRRGAEAVLAAGCVASILAAGAAMAQPAPPTPSPGATETSVSPTESVTQDRLPGVMGPLTLTPDRGEPGEPFTATVTAAYPGVSLGRCGRITFRWGTDVSLPGDVHDGGAEVSLNTAVPAGASPGEYQVTATCGLGGQVAAPFTVPAPATLTLAPGRGAPGTPVTGTVTGFEACATGAQSVSLQWDDEPLDASPAATGGRVIGFEVPAGATAEVHRVIATCGDERAEAPFTVVATERPTLRLDRDHGPGGTRLTASGSGFACGDGLVALRWDDVPVGDGQSGTFSVPLTVPRDASPGVHTVAASCSNDPGIGARQSFTVTDSAPPDTQPAALAVAPDSGLAGDRVRVTGGRFSCADGSQNVQLSWDDGPPVSTVPTDASGRLDTLVSVPAGSASGDHTLRAACADGTSPASAGFTVHASGAPPTTTSPPSRGITGWVVLALIGGAVILAGLVYARSRRQRRPHPNTRVRAVRRPGGPPVVTVRETPARGEATHAIRVEAHSDIGTQTIREVDR